MYIYFAIVSFIIGALLGSFFNVCIYRIPNKKSVVNPPSHCYNCNTRLKPLDLVPILSWTLLRGKCRYCGQKISPRYALVELLTGTLFVLVYIVYGPNIITLYYSLLVSLLVIITLEDPIEYVHDHKQSLVNQREIGQDTESFNSALRAILRQDPDVILVGEMRDPETISIALTAAETGHLVFSTLHTVGAAKTIDRIVDMFPSEQQQQVRTQLSTVCEGVVSQQLIKTIDGRKRVAALEVMVANPAIRNLIRENKTYQIQNIIQTGSKQGMQSMDQELVNLYRRGLISRDSVLSRCTDYEFTSRLVGERY